MGSDVGSRFWAGSADAGFSLGLTKILKNPWLDPDLPNTQESRKMCSRHWKYFRRDWECHRNSLGHIGKVECAQMLILDFGYYDTKNSADLPIQPRTSIRLPDLTVIECEFDHLEENSHDESLSIVFKCREKLIAKFSAKSHDGFMIDFFDKRQSLN